MLGDNDVQLSLVHAVQRLMRRATRASTASAIGTPRKNQKQKKNDITIFCCTVSEQGVSAIQALRTGAAVRRATSSNDVAVAAAARAFAALDQETWMILVTLINA